MTSGSFARVVRISPARRFLPAAGVALSMLLAACGHGGKKEGADKSAPPSGKPAPAGTSDSAAQAGKSRAWAGAPLRGNDRESLRRYLDTVQEVQPKTFKVQWNPATVAIDKASAMRSLRAVSRDGSTYTLDSGDPAVAKLKAGSILWIWDVAVRKVDSVEVAGDVARVHTSSVPLNEAMPNAQIEFEAPLTLTNYYFNKQAPQSFKSARAAPRARTGLMLVDLRDPPPDPSQPLPDNKPEPGESPESGDDAWYEEGMTANGYTGTAKGWTYSIGYQPRGGGISVELQARKGEGGGDNTLVPDKKSAVEALEKSLNEIDEGLDKAHKEIDSEEKGVKDVDQDYQRRTQQLKQDQANRRNPDYSGPKPPSPPTNEHGTPYTDDAVRQQLQSEWDRRRDIEMRKLQATEQILGEWRAKKAQIDAQKRAMKIAKGIAQQLWNVIDDNLDIRFRSRADLDGFSAGGSFSFADGDVKTASTQFKDLHGKVKAELIGRLGTAGTETIKLPVMHLPIQIDVPIPVGGVPFVVQLGADFLLTYALSGQYATLTVNGEVGFNGTSGFDYASGNTNYASTLAATKPSIGGYEGRSPGASAAMLAVQLPRLGLGVGLLGISSVAYMDVVSVETITLGGSAGAGLIGAPCKRMSFTTVGHVGIETNILPLPVPGLDKINNALSTKQEVFKVDAAQLDPPIKGCEI